jgi:sec-independent protein translocase protein TatB
MTPRAALTKHLLDGDDSIFSVFDRPLSKQDGMPSPPTPPTAPPSPRLSDERPAPFDSDAT